MQFSSDGKRTLMVAAPRNLSLSFGLVWNPPSSCSTVTPSCLLGCPFLPQTLSRNLSFLFYFSQLFFFTLVLSFYFGFFSNSSRQPFSYFPPFPLSSPFCSFYIKWQPQTLISRALHKPQFTDSTLAIRLAFSLDHSWFLDESQVGWG